MVATITKTNERPGTRAQHRYARMSAPKARAVLDLIRGLPVDEAADVLRFTDRKAAEVIGKVLASAIANAEHNDELDGESLYISACYADEGPTLKRWRPRARGRATRIRKRTCHITIIVSPMPPEMAAKVEAKRAATGPVAGARGRAAREARRARVARSRGEQVQPESTSEETEATETPTDEDVAGGEPTDETVADAEEAAQAEEADDEAADADEAEDAEASAAEPEDADAVADAEESEADEEEKK